jgi:diamine N-acetyltransferase
VPASPERGEPVSLRPVTRENVWEVTALKVTGRQIFFVMDVPRSLALAHYYSEARPSAIYAGETPVGFLIHVVRDEAPRHFLSRLLIDHRFQGRGFGKQAMRLLVERVKQAGGTDLMTSCEVLEDGPRPFYEALGFVATGEYDEDGEAYLRLDL